jgi:hypothetical protein
MVASMAKNVRPRAQGDLENLAHCTGGATRNNSSVSTGLEKHVRRAGRFASLLDVKCTLGRRDRPFPESHGSWTIAVVRRGSFNYRTVDRRSAHSLREGWLLLGRPTQAYECSHDHDGGDECTVLMVSDQIIDEHGAAFPAAVTAPIARVSALVEQLCASDDADLDEVAHFAVEAVVAQGQSVPQLETRPHHRARVAEAIGAIRNVVCGAASAGRSGGARRDELVPFSARVRARHRHDTSAVSHRRPAAPRGRAATRYLASGDDDCVRRGLRRFVELRAHVSSRDRLLTAHVPAGRG